MSELEHEVDDQGVDDLDGDLALDAERSETVVGGFTDPKGPPKLGPPGTTGPQGPGAPHGVPGKGKPYIP